LRSQQGSHAHQLLAPRSGDTAPTPAGSVRAGPVFSPTSIY
jgi:hypothetical protein